MSHWLLKARSALLHDNASSLDAARKLAVVNGLGEHSRAQVLLSGLLRLSTLTSLPSASGVATSASAPWQCYKAAGLQQLKPAEAGYGQAPLCSLRLAMWRMQGHSAAVKEAVGASLLGCKAPFRLMQDHSRSGRLEASTLALRKVALL